MDTKTKDERIFWLNITEETIYELAEEVDIKREQITPEIMQKVKHMIWHEFRHWDSWLHELLQQLVNEHQ